jgi:hypothetical protein
MEANLNTGVHTGVEPNVCVRPSAEPLVEPRSRGRKFGVDPLIAEGNEGLIFAEPAGAASHRSRGQAQLFYEKGIQETRLVSAMRYREVEDQYTHEEIASAEEIVNGRATVLRDEERLCEKIRKEERRENPDLIRLDRLENTLSSNRVWAEAVREKIFAAPERVLELVTILERLKKLDRKAKGWKLKAQRQIACNIVGRVLDAGKCGASFFRRFRCHNRYCPHCGPHVHKQLLSKYLRMEKPVGEFLAAHPSYQLRILDITAVKRGDDMPIDGAAARSFKADVKRLIERVNHHVAQKLGLPFSKQLTGYLYCLEFGFENNNLHCHGVLLSPYIDQAWLSEQWREIRDDGSFRVHIALARSFETAMKHALEYTGKYAAPSAERAFELEVAFSGCRRVDGLGWFFNRLPKEDEESCDLRCPCGDPECFLKPREGEGYRPISELEELGMRELDEVQEARGSPPEGELGMSWVN